MRYALSILSLLLSITAINSQQLQTYIQEAESNNPEIQAFELRYTIAKEKVNEANSLPNTIVSAGYFVSEPETRTGAQRARLSVSQMLPWFGTITARENYMNSMADAEFVELAIIRRKLAMAVAQSYYELSALRLKQKVLEENVKLLQTSERIALTSVEVGNASMVDVLRLQIRQNELLQQTKALQEEFRAREVVFNNLLNREEGQVAEITPEKALPSEDPGYTQEDLALNSELVKYDMLYESVIRSELLNQKERGPDIGFGLDYVPVSERPDMNFSDNGKDIIMPMVSVSIPIFSTKYEAISKQNELRQMEIQALRHDRMNLLKSALATAISERNQARIMYNTLEANLERANDAEVILTRNFETGTIDFNDVLEIQEFKLKIELERIEAIQMYYKQSAVINYLVN